MDRVVQISLINEKISKDFLLQEIKLEEKSNVFATIKSVSYREFYEAKNVKFNPSIVFIIYSFEYENQPLIEYENKRYKVIRTYLTTDDKIELTSEEIENA